MKALIDADIFQYEFGNATDDEGKPLSWPLVQSRIQGRINGIMEATGADSYQCYLTSDDKSNFRFDIATIRPYKGNRKDLEKPRWYNQIRNFLKDHRSAIEIHGMEADDALSIEQCKNKEAASEFLKNNGGLRYYSEEYNINCWEELLREWGCTTIICSRDKDLDMVPGWHYSWSAGKQKEKELWWQDEISGLRSFYKQLLLGDSVDNIPGLYGVGKSSKLITDLDSRSSNLEMYESVYAQYFKRFGSYAEQFLIENARLLWMLQEEGQLWNPPTKEDNSETTSCEEKEEY